MTRKRVETKENEKKYTTKIQIIAAVVGIVLGNGISSWISYLTHTRNIFILSYVMTFCFSMVLYFKMLPVIDKIARSHKKWQ